MLQVIGYLQFVLVTRIHLHPTMQVYTPLGLHVFQLIVQMGQKVPCIDYAVLCIDHVLYIHVHVHVNFHGTTRVFTDKV